MRILPVISPNVIRQAIEWHAIPKPLRVHVESSFAFPDGRQQSTVYVYFDIPEVVDALGLSHFKATSRYAFMYHLQECFCADIRVVDVALTDNDNECAVSLSCTIAKRDHE